MKHVLDFLKPRGAVLAFSFFALFWQYFYSFTQYNEGYFGVVREYLETLLDLVNWQNGLIRTFSLGLIWLLVAFVIFLTLVTFESVSIYFYNRKIQSKYVNQPHEDFAHLLKKREINIKRHLPAHLLLSASIMVYVLSIANGTDFIERIRSEVLGEYLFKLQIRIPNVDFNASIPQAISFFISFLFWYLVSCFAHFLYRLSAKMHEDEKIIEDHYGAIIPE